MKTRFIIYTIIAFLCLVMIFAFKKAQVSNTNPKFVIIRVVLPATGPFIDAKMLVKDETGQTREIKLKQGLATGSFELYSTEFLNVFNEFYGKGYKLVSSTGGDSVTTYILAKD